MRIEPTGKNVLIEPIQPKSQIQLPNEYMTAVADVIAIGPETTGLLTATKVMYHPSKCSKLDHGGKVYVFISSDDVLAVVGRRGD